MARRKVFDPEALKLMRVEVNAIHGSVKLAGPQVGGIPNFPSDKLTRLYSEMSSYGFSTFTLLPQGAHMSTPPAREASVGLDQTTLVEELGMSGAALQSFAELAAILYDKVQSILGIEGFQGLRVRLVAFWPVPSGDAVSFVSRATRLPPTVSANLGSGFDVAGIRFHKGTPPNPAEEWDIRVEPLLRQRDQLWIEVEPKYKRQFASGAEIANLVQDADRFLRDQTMSAVMAMAGNKKGA